MIKRTATRNPTRSGRARDPTADHGSAGSRHILSYVTRNPTRSGRARDLTADHGSARSTVLNPVLGRTLVALSLALMVTFVGCQPDRTQPPETSPTRAMKGYELYSWQMQGDWYFALVVGTNRIKTYDEISLPKVRLQGLKALEREFDRLPRGEQVFWSAQRVPNTILPPDEMVDKVKAYCRQRGLRLEIAQGEVTEPEIIMSDVTWEKQSPMRSTTADEAGLEGMPVAS